MTPNDLLIAVAYFSIPLQMLFSLYKYPRLAQTTWHMHVLLVLFALFIFLCGAGHLLRALNRHDGLLFEIINTFTMIISVATALYLVPIVPYIMSHLDQGLQDLIELNHDLRDSKQKLMTFMAFVCHEIRNPLFAITTTMSFMCDEELTSSQEAAMSSIQQSANLMLRLVNDVLDISKLESGKLELEEHPFDLYHLIQGVATSTKSHICKRSGSDVVFKSLVDRHCPRYIEGDSVRILQIVYNLLSNSCKFTSQGYIELKVSVAEAEVGQLPLPLNDDTGSNRNDDEEEALPLTKHLEREKIVLQLVVTDTGCGIEQDKLGSIFEAYNQSKLSDYRMFGGTGLGLSILDKLVDIMGGTIDVQSHVGVGSTFTVSLPVKVTNGVAPRDDHAEDATVVKLANVLLSELDDAPVSRTAPKKDVLAVSNQEETKEEPAEETKDIECGLLTKKNQFVKFEFPREGPVVLVVDDNLMNRKLLGRMLKHFGLEYILAENGQEAVDKYKASLSDPDAASIGLVLMDLCMPVMDGCTATKEIRKLKTQVPIIALTANALAEGGEKALSVGVNEFCTKPILRADLYDKCRQYLKQEPERINGVECL